MNASLAVPPFLVPTWRDVVQILLVALVIYRGLRYLVGTKALQIVLGLAPASSASPAWTMAK